MGNFYGGNEFKNYVNAKIKFVKTPLMLTINVSLLYFLKFIGFIGTGFAQPNPTSKKPKTPYASICFNGLIVSLPSAFGVESPSLYAENAWANSWRPNAITIAKIYANTNASIFGGVKPLLTMFPIKYIIVIL